MSTSLITWITSRASLADLRWGNGGGDWWHFNRGSELFIILKISRSRSLSCYRIDAKYLAGFILLAKIRIVTTSSFSRMLPKELNYASPTGGQRIVPDLFHSVNRSVMGTATAACRFGALHNYTTTCHGTDRRQQGQVVKVMWSAPERRSTTSNVSRAALRHLYFFKRRVPVRVGKTLEI